MQLSHFNLKGHYFDGQFYRFPSNDENHLVKTCPANTEQVLWSMPVSEIPIQSIIHTAQKGFDRMRSLTREQRCQLLKKYQKALLKRKNELSVAISLESGKPLWESQEEVNAVIGKVDITIKHSLPRIEDTTVDNIMPNTKGLTVHRPLGICLVIGPFNFPCHLANTQILSALVAGNSIIFKPSEKTAYSGQILIECFHEASFPKGVINLVQTTGTKTLNLLKDQSVKGIFFTGSMAVGKKILKETSNDLSKLVALELGGKNTAIISEDAQYDHALQEMLKACFLTTGQRCVNVSTIAVQSSMVDTFIKDFHRLVQKIHVDHPIQYEHEPFMGPIIDGLAFDSFFNAIDTAKVEKIEEVMKARPLETKYKGHYLGPAIHFTKKFNATSSFLTQELFGPSAVIVPFNNIDDAIEMANATEYGLAACLFSKKREDYVKCLHEIEAGVINFNRSTCGASARLPFGGVKNSGNYRPASVDFINSCVYKVAGLDINSDSLEKVEHIKGLSI